MRAVHANGEVVYFANDVEDEIARLRGKIDRQRAHLRGASTEGRRKNKALRTMSKTISRLQKRIAELETLAPVVVNETASDARQADLSLAGERQAPAHAEPVAWAEVFKGGKIASIRLARDEYRTVPLYTHPTPAPVVPAEGLDALLLDLHDLASDAYDNGKEHESNTMIRAYDAITALRSAPPVGARVTVKPGEIERAVWSAMIWAASNNVGFEGVPEYTDHGNSFAEDEARRAAARILAALLPAGEGRALILP